MSSPERVVITVIVDITREGVGLAIASDGNTFAFKPLNCNSRTLEGACRIVRDVIFDRGLEVYPKPHPISDTI